MTERELKKLVEKRLRTTLHPDVWQLLKDDYYVGEVLEAREREDVRERLQDLIRRARRLQKLTGSQHRTPSPQPTTVNISLQDSTSEAVSALLAYEAAQHPRVRRMFKRELPSLPLDALQSPYMGEPPSGCECVGDGVRFIRLTDGVMLREHRQVYVPPGGEVWHEFAMTVDLLSTKFGFNREDAIRFLQQGEVPPLTLRVSAVWGTRVPMLILEVPVWTEPEVVRRVYRAVRQKLWRGLRFRPFTRRQADAIVRACQHLLHHPAATWEEVAVNVGVKKSLLQLWWTRARQKLRRWRSPAGSSAPDAEAP